MKKKYLFIEFILFFFILIIPPLFVTSATPFGTESSSFSWLPLFEQLLISILLTVQYVKLIVNKSTCCKRHPFFTLSKGTLTFGMIAIVYAAMETLSVFMPPVLKGILSKSVEKPVSSFGWIHFAIGIFVSAFYEESLYRQFMPEVTILLAQEIPCKTETYKKWIEQSIETAWVLIFAFSHRYIGITAVLNALFCGIILRRCFKATGSVLAGTLAHFAYNSLMVFFYFI